MAKLAPGETDQPAEVVTIRSAGRPTPAARQSGGAGASGEGTPTPALDDILNRIALQETPPLYIVDLEGKLLFANLGYGEISSGFRHDREMAVADQPLPPDVLLALDEVPEEQLRCKSPEMAIKEAEFAVNIWCAHRVRDDV